MALINLSDAIATASSFFSNDPQYNAPKAIDGNASTFYSANTANLSEFWQLDLGSSATINFVNIIPVSSALARTRNIRVTASTTADFANPITIGDTPSNTSASNSVTVTPGSAVTARYIRLAKTSSTDAVTDTLTLAEVQVDGVLTAQTPLSLSGATATASSFFSNDPQYNPPKAIDGNASTFYSANTANLSEFWQLDLGATADVNSVRITPFSGTASRQRNIRITGSLNADLSNPIILGDTPSDTSASSTITVTPASPVFVRYIRLQKTSSTDAVTDTLTLAEVQVFGAFRTVAATTYTLTSPETSSGLIGVASGNYTVSLSGGTVSSPVTITPSDNGGGGTFTPATVQFTSSVSSVIFTYTPGSAGSKTISVANNGGLTNPSSVTYTASAGGGTFTSVAVTVAYSGNNVILTAVPNAGTAPFTYQWHKYSISGTILSGATSISGATNNTYTDSSVKNDIVYYKCVATDSTSVTVTSYQVVAQVTPSALRIGFIGDSITNQAGSLTDYIAALTSLFSGGVTVNNRGIGGTETSDWLPAGTNYINAKSSFVSGNVEYVSIMLGTNDANVSSRTASDYRTNLQSIVNDLVSSGFKVILNTSPYEMPLDAGGAVSTVTDAKLDLLQQYRRQIPQLVDNVNVFLGDIAAFSYFAKNQNELLTNGVATSPGSLGDGLHPSLVGSSSLQKLWASALQRAILRQQLPATGGVVRSGTTTIAATVIRGGTNLQGTPFSLTGSVFDVNGTIVYYFDTTGLKSWQKGRSTFLNTLPGTNKDQIPAYASFQVFPGGAITVQNSQFSFGSVI